MVPRYDLKIMKVSCVAMWKWQRLGGWYANYVGEIDVRKPGVVPEGKVCSKTLSRGFVQCKFPSKEARPDQ